MLIALLPGQPLAEKKLLGFVPIFQGAAFGATLPQPDGMREGLDLFLFPGLHGNKMNFE